MLVFRLVLWLNLHPWMKWGELYTKAVIPLSLVIQQSVFWWGCREEITSNSGLPFPGNHLLFQQVPMVEIDGMKLVQTRSILHYIADKHHLFGKDLKERTLYCGPSGVFSLVHLPMLNQLVVLYSTPVHFMSCIVSGNREQSPRKVKTS